MSWIKNTLDKYKALISPRAVRDLDSIYEYIAKEKLSPPNDADKTVTVITVQYQRRNI